MVFYLGLLHAFRVWVHTSDLHGPAQVFNMFGFVTLIDLRTFCLRSRQSDFYVYEQ